ncbi:MAG: serine hydrolase, partial [Sinomicrobium sp.]|nr:serine hydrolase [Sinomicrobium sp.]
MRKQFKTQQEYLDFPYRTFIDKIGMYSMVLEADLSGHYVGSSYAWATPRDWAKFGLLYLHRGNWNGVQVIAPSWVDYVATPAPNSEKRYGGHFWINAGGYMPDIPRDAFFANGFEGQRILIIPSKDMVVVRFGLTKEGAVDFNAMMAGIVSAVR